MKRILFVSIFTSICIVPVLPVEAKSCHDFNSSSKVNELWPGFGMPFDVFTATKLNSGTLVGNDSLITADCPDRGVARGVKLEFGDTRKAYAIFEDAYIINSVDNVWEKLNLSQTTDAKEKNTSVQNLLEDTNFIAYEASSGFAPSSIPNNADVYVAAYLLARRAVIFQE